MLTNNCNKNNAWNAWICNERYVALTLYTNTPQLASVTLSQSGKTHRMFGSGAAPGTDFRSILRPNQSYNLSMQTTLPSSFGLVLQDGNKKHLRLDIALNRRPTVSRYGNILTAVASLSALESANKSSFFYNSTTKVLQLKIVGVNWYNPNEGVNYEEITIQP
jgi:hypothetical protein